MVGMGVNTITIELRTSDPPGTPETFPTCGISDAIGFQWPQPTAVELANLPLYFDLAQSKGIKVILVLVNTHMEEQPPTNSQTWLGAILNVVGSHPALDFVVFNGDAHTLDSNCDGILDACGGQAEAPLWIGSTSIGATYVTWAINYAMSLGMPPTKLSAGTIVGDFFTDSQAPSCLLWATDGHLWSPIIVMKGIFDSSGIPITNAFMRCLSTSTESARQHEDCRVWTPALPYGPSKPCKMRSRQLAGTAERVLWRTRNGQPRACGIHLDDQPGDTESPSVDGHVRN